MAETADILSRPEVEVYLPDMAAGCSMADMADLDSVEAAWMDLGEIIDTDDLMPVTYINSTADLKAFCGRHGGIVCTSTECAGRAGLGPRKPSPGPFLPGPALGPEYGPKHGDPAEQMLVWDPRLNLGGHTQKPSRVRGSCSGRAIVRFTRCSNLGTLRSFENGFRASRSWFIPNA